MAGWFLGDWCFATALGIAGKEIDSFMGVNERLRRAEYRHAGLADALLDLERQGRWARIFLLPSLCAINRNRPATPEGAVAKRILLDLISGEPPPLREALGNTVRDSSGSSEGREVLITLERSAELWAAAEDPTEFSSTLDYSDVEGFSVPALILSTAVVLAGVDSVGLETASSRRSTIKIAQVVSAALAGHYGRLCFLLALDMGQAAPAVLGEDTAVDALRRIPPEKLCSTLDVLERLPRILLLRLNDGRPSSEIVKELSRELVTLRGYRSWFGSKVERWSATALTVWINAVWNLMLDTDITTAARLLSTTWLPRIQSAAIPEVVTIPMQSVSSEHGALIQLMHAPRGRSKQTIRIDGDISADLGQAAPILSPWLAQKAWLRQTSTERMRWLAGLARIIHEARGLAA